jgi:hypothetical protein
MTPDASLGSGGQVVGVADPLSMTIRVAVTKLNLTEHSA